MRKLNYVIADLPDDENLVAELWDGDTNWGMICIRDGQLFLSLYTTCEGSDAFPLAEFVSVIKDAHDRLIALHPGTPGE